MRSILNRFRNITIGKNNTIARCVVIHDNVIIGDNNFIGKNVIIYPNTIIGNNNQIFNGNIIGEVPVHSGNTVKEYNVRTHKGVVIGDNNLLHVGNLICQGLHSTTYIGNNTQLLAQCHIGHDTWIGNGVTLYPRVITGGYTKLLDKSNLGMCASIQQRCVIGQYSMVGGSYMTTRSVFPFYVTIANKLHRLNTHKIPAELAKYDSLFREMNDRFNQNDFHVHLSGNPTVDSIIKEYVHLITRDRPGHLYTTSRKEPKQSNPVTDSTL